MSASTPAIINAPRRALTLGLPAALTVGLYGCGGAESDDATQASTQSANRFQAESSSSASGSLSIRNRTGNNNQTGNFPMPGEGAASFDWAPQAGLVQAVINQGSPAGLGPVLSINVSGARAWDTSTWIANVAMTVKLGDKLPALPKRFNLAPGGALGSDAWITCRQLSDQGLVKTHAFRIVSGWLDIIRIDADTHAVTISLSEILATAAPGFANAAAGTLTLVSNGSLQLNLAFENSGTLLA